MARSAPLDHRSLGIIGFGAFGRLIAEHMRGFVKIHATDALPIAKAPHGVTPTDLAGVCACDIVVLAVPVSELEPLCMQIAPLLRPGALVMDVGSVKVEPARIMAALLPRHVSLIATHPLFGPQSIKGAAGLKLVMCPIRGTDERRIAAFLRKAMGLRIIRATPEEHDREAAYTQGLTHLIARALLPLEALRRITTRSFDLLWEAVSMVRHDAVGVTAAIENGNPYAMDARQSFFAEMDRLRQDLG